MTTDRSNLDNANSNKTYIVLTLTLIVLSAVGFYLYSLLPQKTSGEVIVDRSAVPENVYLTPTPRISNTNPQSPTFVPATKGGFGESQSGVLTTDTFALKYSPDRKLYQDREGSGTRYTLYSPTGNIAIHVGPTWSWVHPGRVFSSDLLVSGQATFVYKTSSQTITDFQVAKTKYTVQCVHGGSSAIQSECDQLLKDFSLN